MCRELKRSINSNFCAAKSKVKIKGVGENGNQKSEGDSSPVCPTVKPGFGSSLSGLGRLCPLGLGGESQEARAGAWIDRMGEAWQPLFSMSWFLGSRGLGAQQKPRWVVQAFPASQAWALGPSGKAWVLWEAGRVCQGQDISGLFLLGGSLCSGSIKKSQKQHYGDHGVS